MSKEGLARGKSSAPHPSRATGSETIGGPTSDPGPGLGRNLKGGETGARDQSRVQSLAVCTQTPNPKRSLQDTWFMKQVRSCHSMGSPVIQGKSRIADNKVSCLLLAMPASGSTVGHPNFLCHFSKPTCSASTLGPWWASNIQSRPPRPSLCPFAAALRACDSSHREPPGSVTSFGPYTPVTCVCDFPREPHANYPLPDLRFLFT